MFIGVAKVTMIIADAQSLKYKRQGVRKIKDRTRVKFNCAVAEVGDQDLWQKTMLGFSTVGSDQKIVDSTLKKIINFIESLHVGRIIDEDLEVIPFT